MQKQILGLASGMVMSSCIFLPTLAGNVAVASTGTTKPVGDSKKTNLPAPAYKLTRLPSGRQIKLVSMKPV